ncbi:hypothetical protein SprV_0301170100 [Sparganum proliferum]
MKPKDTPRVPGNRISTMMKCLDRMKYFPTGTDYAAWRGVLGAHGIGNCNDDGLLLLRIPPFPGQHLLPPTHSEEGDLDAPPIAALAAAGQCLTFQQLITPAPGRTASPDDDDNDDDDDASVGTPWCQLLNATQSIALDALGRTHRQHQDWFDHNDADITSLLVEKHGLHKANTGYRTNAIKETFQYLRFVQRRLGLRLHNQRSRATSQFRRNDTFDGETTDSEALGRTLQRSPQLLTHSLRRPHRPTPSSGNERRPGSPAFSPKNNQSCAPTLQQETDGTLHDPGRSLQARQTPADGPPYTLFQVWCREQLPRQLCDNHGGISLLNIAGEIFAHILLNRFNGHLKQRLLSESQFVLRRHRKATDMTIAARQLQEKCQEMRTQLYTTLMDLTKAFDTDTFRRNASTTGQHQLILPLTPAANPTTTTTPVTDDHTVAAPLPSITDNTGLDPIPASTTATGSANTTTSRTPSTDATASDVPSSATITTISTPTSSDVDSVHTCPHYDRISA